MELFGIQVHPRNLLTPEDDATIMNITAASSINEKHAIGYGYGLVILVVGGLGAAQVLGVDPVLGALSSLGIGGVGAAIRAVRAGRLEGHLRDAVRELGYTAVGAFLGLVHVTVTAIALRPYLG